MYWHSSLAAAKSLQSCPTLCDPIDGSPPGSSVPGILQARILEWVTISCSNAWKWKVKVKSLSYVQFFATPWTVAYQTPLFMGFSRQEYWSGLPWPWSDVKSLSHVRLFVTPWTVACTRLLRPWDPPGKSTGVGCHCLLLTIDIDKAN